MRNRTRRTPWEASSDQLAASPGRIAYRQRGTDGVDRGARFPGAGRTDQVGEMARAVLVFRDNLVAARNLTETALENARRTAVATTQASDAIGQVSDGAMTQLAELRQVEDPMQRAALSVELFGDMAGETSDALLGMDPATAAASAGMGDVSDASTDLTAALGQDPAASFVLDRVEDELAYGMENLGVDPAHMRPRVEETLDLLDIEPLRARSVRTLSGGERQRVAIAAALFTGLEVSNYSAASALRLIALSARLESFSSVLSSSARVASRRDTASSRRSSFAQAFRVP